MCARVEPEAGDQDTVRKKECLRHVWMMTPESVQRLLTKTYDPQSQRYVRCGLHLESYKFTQFK